MGILWKNGVLGTEQSIQSSQFFQSELQVNSLCELGSIQNNGNLNWRELLASKGFPVEISKEDFFLQVSSPPLQREIRRQLSEIQAWGKIRKCHTSYPREIWHLRGVWSTEVTLNDLHSLVFYSKKELEG